MRNRIARVAVLSTVVALVLFLMPLMVAVYSLSVAETRSQLERDALTAVTHIDRRFSAADRTEGLHPRTRWLNWACTTAPASSSPERVQLALTSRCAESYPEHAPRPWSTGPW